MDAEKSEFLAAFCAKQAHKADQAMAHLRADRAALAEATLRQVRASLAALACEAAEQRLQRRLDALTAALMREAERGSTDALRALCADVRARHGHTQADVHAPVWMSQQPAEA